MKKRMIAAAFTAAAAAACCVQHNNRLEANRYSVFADIPRPLKALCLCDLHGKQFGRDNERLLEKARRLSPDMILFSGDTISESTKNRLKTLSAIKSLCDIAPCFLIAGNHEHRSGRWKQLKKEYKAAGVTVLENERWDGEINGVSVHILGLDEGLAVSRTDYLRAALKTLKYADNSAALSELSCLDGARIVLSHFPENFALIGDKSYCRFDFDLMVSGHAHGGHIRFSDKSAFFAAGQGFLPKFCQGTYGSRPTLFVSRGLGNDSPLPRINNRPEMALITLSNGICER